jgi:hypothetical protein
VLAITTGKKTIEQDRAESRERQAKKRTFDKEKANGGKYMRKDVRDIVAKVEAEIGKDAALDIVRTVASTDVGAGTVADLHPEHFDEVYVVCAQALVTTSQQVRDVTEMEAATTDDTSTAPAETSDEPKQVTSAKGFSAVKGTGLSEFNNHAARLVQMTKSAKLTRYSNTDIPTNDLANLGAFLSGMADLKSQTNLVSQEKVELSAEQSAEAHATDDIEAGALARTGAA